MNLQQTLISLYGRKSEVFSKYISGLISLLGNSPLGSSIDFYEPEQVHATLIGLEAVEEAGRLVNRNLLVKEGRGEAMCYDRIPELISRHFPMKVRFGGFKAEDEDFLSRGKRPWERSFSIDLRQKRIIVMGWPHEEGDFSLKSLQNFRDEMGSSCHIRHKYSDDNDLYMVLGELNETINLSSDEILRTENIVRTHMSERSLDIEISDLFRVGYEDPRLPLKTTRVFRELIP